MGRIEKLREAEKVKSHKLLEEKVNNETIVKSTIKAKSKTKQFSIEAEIEDFEKLKLAVLKLSNRDNVLHKKKDIYTAMVKMFLEKVDNDINSIEISGY